jgi:predicted DNA-binding protein (UPF0278 family)
MRDLSCCGSTRKPQVAIVHDAELKRVVVSVGDIICSSSTYIATSVYNEIFSILIRNAIDLEVLGSFAS